jgi:ribosomal protein S18 acetylase RimI-like enzyme
MVRPMKKSDKAAVMDILRRSGMFTPEEIAVAEEQIDIGFDESEQEDYNEMVVEDAQGRTAGWMSWGPTPMTEGTYDLYWIAVDPDMQGQGLGKELVRWLEDHVRKTRGRLILIETASQAGYESTRQFYLKQNYQEAARIADYYKPGDDRIIYAKYFG